MKTRLLAVATTGLFAFAACSNLAKPPTAIATEKAEPVPASTVFVSGIDKANFDNTVRPQDDLFRAVNGGLIAKLEIPADRGGYGALDKLYEDTQADLNKIIEDAAAAGDNAPGSEAQKVGDLYASFMDENTVESFGFKPIKAELARIEAIQSKRELPTLMAHYLRIDITSPVGGGVGLDSKDARRYTMYFDQNGLGMPSRDYYLSNDAKFVRLRAAYSSYVGKNLTLIGIEDAPAAARRVLALETRIAQAQWTKLEMRDAEKIYNRMSVAQLKALTPGFDWNSYFQAAGLGTTNVVVGEPSYFREFSRILRDTSLDTWKLYFKHFVVRDFSRYLSKDFVNTRFDFYGRTLDGIPENRPRWKRGVRLVDSTLGEALGKLYVARHFPPANKVRMEKLVAQVLKAYDAEIGALDWMSAETKMAARAKLSKIAVKIGYPAVWRDYAALEIRQDDLLGNIIRAKQFEYQRGLDQLGAPADRGEWLLSVQAVNAKYNPEMNDITFPAAILQPPFFNAEADDAVNYGAIGRVIAHEISHGFDDQGSKYDGDGNLKDWWTPEDRARFLAKGKALIAQYAAYEPVKGFHVDGALSLGENIADLAGMTVAFKAYQLSLDGKPAPVIDGFTGEQRVYIGFAQVWAEKNRDEWLSNLLKTDTHPPGEFRCNGTVTNVSAFYSAFGVKQGDKLFKPEAERISIW